MKNLKTNQISMEKQKMKIDKNKIWSLVVHEPTGDVGMGNTFVSDINEIKEKSNLKSRQKDVIGYWEVSDESFIEYFVHLLHRTHHEMKQWFDKDKDKEKHINKTFGRHYYQGLMIGSVLKGMEKHGKLKGGKYIRVKNTPNLDSDGPVPTFKELQFN